MSDGLLVALATLAVALVGGWVTLRNSKRADRTTSADNAADQWQEMLREARTEHSAQMARRDAQDAAAAVSRADQDRQAREAMDAMMAGWRDRLTVAVDHAEALHQHIEAHLPPPAPPWPAALRIA